MKIFLLTNYSIARPMKAVVSAPSQIIARNMVAEGMGDITWQNWKTTSGVKVGTNKDMDAQQCILAVDTSGLSELDAQVMGDW